MRLMMRAWKLVSSALAQYSTCDNLELHLALWHGSQTCNLFASFITSVIQRSDWAWWFIWMRTGSNQFKEQQGSHNYTLRSLHNNQLLLWPWRYRRISVIERLYILDVASMELVQCLTLLVENGLANQNKDVPVWKIGSYAWGTNHTWLQRLCKLE